jgi:hypothetical protein
MIIAILGLSKFLVSGGNMKDLILILAFCFLMTETQGAEVSVSDLNQVESSKTVDFWYFDIGPKDK